jgi:hypothetical protein
MVALRYWRVVESLPEFEEEELEPPPGRPDVALVVRGRFEVCAKSEDDGCNDNTVKIRARGREAFMDC